MTQLNAHDVTQVKQVVQTHWDARAATFDDTTHHAIHSDEQRAAWERLLHEVLPPRSGLHALDVGSGTGFLSLLLAEAGHTVEGIDIAPAMVERAQQKARERGLPVTFAVGDAEAVAGPDQRCDVVIERHVLWTLPRPEVALAEWWRLLRPGGCAVLIEGNWGDTGQNPDYAPIREALPLLGGRPASRIMELLTAAGFVELQVHELQDAALWGGEQRGERYALVGSRPS